MLTDTELTDMQTIAESALPDTATIQRKTRTADSIGGATVVWANLATVACRFTPAGGSPQERLIAQRLSPRSVFRITLPAETDVRAADRIVIDGQTYDVAGLLLGSWETARRVVAVSNE